MIMKKKPSVLFTSICGPFDKLLGRFPANDQMAFRLTRGQEPFVLYEHTHLSSLHLMAQNLSLPSVVLEYPSMDDLARELENGYSHVAISFKVCNTDRLMEMCRLIRKKSPGSKIIVGGYGAICLPGLFKDQRKQNLIDYVCRGDGISFMRELLEDPPAEEITCKLPKIGSTLPWMSPHPMGTIGIILSGLGCTFACHFCTTSAATRGKYIEIMNARQIYHAMRDYWKNSPLTNSATIYDENFLNYKEKVSRLGKYLQKDEEFGLKRFNYFAFGSLSALAKYDPDELLLNGIDTLWIGVESKFSPLKKRRGMDVQEAFRMLHSTGIKSVGSLIVGEDLQTPENIHEDSDEFISLDPTFQQIAILIVSPGIPLYDNMKKKGRIPGNVPWKDYHLYGNNFIYKHFTHKELTDHVEGMYNKIHREKGPALAKVLEVNLNGFEYCMKSSHPLLYNHKSHFFRSRCESYSVFLKALRAHAPSSSVRSRLDNLAKRYIDIFGPFDALKEKTADQILRKADAEMKRRQTGPPPSAEETFRRYTYLSRDKRPARRPYSVEYKKKIQ